MQRHVASAVTANVYWSMHLTGFLFRALKAHLGGVCPLPAATPPAPCPPAACDTARCPLQTSPSRNQRRPTRSWLPVVQRPQTSWSQLGWNAAASPLSAARTWRSFAFLLWRPRFSPCADSAPETAPVGVWPSRQYRLARRLSTSQQKSRLSSTGPSCIVLQDRGCEFPKTKKNPESFQRLEFYPNLFQEWQPFLNSSNATQWGQKSPDPGCSGQNHFWKEQREVNFQYENRKTQVPFGRLCKKILFSVVLFSGIERKKRVIWLFSTNHSGQTCHLPTQSRRIELLPLWLQLWR